MDTLNSDMTGEPNQQNRPSVFAFDPYLQQSVPSNWQKSSPHQLQSYPDPAFGNVTGSVPIPSQSPQGFLPSQPPMQPRSFTGNFVPPSTSPVATNYVSPAVIPGSFSFGSSEAKPTSYPVHFPFPSSSSMNPAALGSTPMMGSSGMSSQPSPYNPTYRQTVSSRQSSTPGNFPTTSRRGAFGSPSYTFGSRHQELAGGKSDDYFTLIRGKRKCKTPPLQPFKRRVTEEMMTEHMSNLHINSETALPNETLSTRQKRLYMCAEMRKLQNESIIPQSLLNRISRPCTALVLWTPPPKVFPNISSAPDENRNTTMSQEQNEASSSDQMENEPVDIEIDSNPVTNDMDYDL